MQKTKKVLLKLQKNDIKDAFIVKTLTFCSKERIK